MRLLFSQRMAERTGAVVCEREYDLAVGVLSEDIELLSRERPEVLTISADGLMVHSDGAWTEMKCVSSMSKEYGRSTIATMERDEKSHGLGQAKQGSALIRASARGYDAVCDVALSGGVSGQLTGYIHQ